MVKVAIGILVVCLLTLGVNAVSAAVLPKIPWFDSAHVSRWLGKPVRLALRFSRSAGRWIRGPNRLWPQRYPRAGTGRQWDVADTLELPRDTMR